MPRTPWSPLLLLVLLAAPAAPARAGDAVDLLPLLTRNAEGRAFFEATDATVVYRTDRVEYWDAGFDEAGLTERYPADRWAAFELGELKVGKTRIVALVELDDDGTDLMKALEMGDGLYLTLTYLDRLPYEWTDAVLGRTEERELVLMRVETLSYALPRMEGYTTLWYDRSDPSHAQRRTHLQQDGLANISTPMDPGSSHALDLSPGSYALFFFPEIDQRTLPITIEASGGTLVFGVLSGQLELHVLEAGQTPQEGERGHSLVALALPDDVRGKSLVLVRDQRDAAYFLLLVPQDSTARVRGKLVVGQP